MVDTLRTDAFLLASELQDGQIGAISAADMRDLVVSKVNVARARNTQTASWTLALTDAGGIVEMNSTSATTVTVPPNASVAFPVGLEIPIYQASTGQVSIAAGAGVTIVTPSTLILASRYAVASVTQRAANVWYLSGELQPLATVVAQRTGDFLDSLGVNTAISSYISAFFVGDGTTKTMLLTHLQYVGISNIRDHFATTAGDAVIVNIYGYLAANGIKLCLVLPTVEDSATITPANIVTAANNTAALATSPFCGIEGPNEPTGTNYVYAAATSSPTLSPGFLPVALGQAASYAALKANAVTNGVPIVHPSYSGGADPLDNGLQWLSVPYGYSHVTLTTNGTTAIGNNTLHFASTTGVQVGAFIYDATTNSRIGANTTVVSTTGTTVVMSSTAVSIVPSAESIRFGARVADQTIFSDIANLHTYPLFGANFGSGVVYSAQSIDPALAGGGSFYTQGLKDYYVTPYGAGGGNGPTLAAIQAKPRWVTEYGYASYMTGYTQGNGACDQTTAGKNILTAWLNAWVGGYAKFFIFTMYNDANPENSIVSSWGLYSWTGVAPFTFTAKTMATNLHNLTTILADPSAYCNSFAPGALRYAITGLPSGGQSLLFQAASSVFMLVIWNNVNNFNTSTGAVIGIGGTSVTVNFERQGTIAVYDPTIGTSAQSTATGSVVTVTLTDYPLVVSFT